MIFHCPLDSKVRSEDHHAITGDLHPKCMYRMRCIGCLVNTEKVVCRLRQPQHYLTNKASPIASDTSVYCLVINRRPKQTSTNLDPPRALSQDQSNAVLEYQVPLMSL
ncbi:hypothetical protein H9L39_12919 [Fusarium oxysporum f. sp. albedinis]|nr:hypothetical protein H9L39_12919 [Fusarium oxysporum f. sp. albedinis]